MLIAIDGDIDRAFRSLHIACVTMDNCRAWLETLLDRHDWLHCRCLCLLSLLSRFLLILHTCQDGIARTIAIIGDALTAGFVGPAIQLLHLLNGMLIGSVHRLADAG